AKPAGNGAPDMNHGDESVLCGLKLRVATDVIAENDCLGDFLHRLALLPALALESEIGLLLVHSQVALQDTFRALDDFASLQLFGEGGVSLFEPSHFNFRSDEKTDGGDHANLASAVD